MLQITLCPLRYALHVTSALAFTLLFLTSAFAINPGEINWQHHTGQDPNDPAIEYSLISIGFFRADLSSDFESVMAAWLKNHPKAQMLPVIARGPMNERLPNSKLIFVWIVDRHDNLNVYLVRHGCVAAAQMFSFSDDELRALRDELKVPKDKLQVSQKEHDNVKKRLLRAEKLAKAEHAGIWSEP